MSRRRVGEEMKFCSVSPRVGYVKNTDAHARLVVEIVGFSPTSSS